MENVRIYDLNEFENMFDVVFQLTLNVNMTPNTMIERLFGVSLEDIVTYYKQFQQRRQCYQRLQLYHYCLTCYGRAVCMCEDCFNPDDHQGHNVHQTRGNGYCDCGIFKNGGFINCRHHNCRVDVKKNLLEIAFGEQLDYAKRMVKIVFRKIYLFISRTHDQGSLTRFANFMDGCRSLLQCEALYQLIAIASSETTTGNDSFFELMFGLLNTSRVFGEQFMELFVFGWICALAAHPANFKHYKMLIQADYRQNVRFLSESLLTMCDFDRTQITVTDPVVFDRVLYILYDIISIYFHPDFLNIDRTNQTIRKTHTKIKDIMNQLIKGSRFINLANKGLLERMLLFVSTTMTHYQTNFTTLRPEDMEMFCKFVLLFIPRCESRIIGEACAIVSSSTNPIAKNLSNNLFIETLKSNRIDVIKMIANKTSSKCISLPSVEFTTFINPEQVTPMKTTLDFMDITQLNSTEYCIPINGSEMNIIKLMIEMEEYEKTNENSNLQEFILSKYPEMENPQVFSLIVWYMNFDSSKIIHYFNQRYCYTLSDKTIRNPELKVAPKRKLQDMMYQMKTPTKPICNPFVPLTYGYQQNLYLVTCYMTSTIIGKWKGEEKRKVLESYDLSQLLFESIERQPLYVIHVLWKRILYNIKLPGDEFGILLFALFGEFLQKYPMFKNDMFKLSLAYENVTEGSQRNFIESMK